MQPARLTLKSLWRLYNAAQSLLKRGHTADAACHFRRIATARLRRPRGATADIWDDRNPLECQARLGLCYCYVEQGHLEQAQVELSAVLSAEPENAEALCELAYILSLRGNRDDAKIALEKAVANNPESARAHKAL